MNRAERGVAPHLDPHQRWFVRMPQFVFETVVKTFLISAAEKACPCSS
jgi:hypothetical protein